MLKFLWRRFVADRLVEMLRHRMGVPALQAEVARLGAYVDGFGRANFFLPDLAVHPQIADHPFMADSSCSAKDFFHPDFARICAMLDLRPTHHRKIWEYAFIVHHLERFGLLGPGAQGKRGLGFGVGAEPLPSLFAKHGAAVTATDAPLAVGVDAGWASTDQHAGALDQVFNPAIIDRATFDAQVSFRPCDMRAIDPDLTDYDFCWSSCCFEHLGDLRAGLEFVRESVEKTLKIGGVACHTTELNLSSNDHTIDSGVTVLYRRRDLEEFADMMRGRGHRVDPIRVAPDSHWLDLHVDLPPYKEKPHLKLEMMGVLTTSVGLVITRGR